MGRKKRRKHFKKYKSVQQVTQTAAAAAVPQNVEPTLSLKDDTDIQKPTTPAISEVKKIGIIMTLLVFVVAAVAIINVQTSWVSSAGSWLMNALHIYGA